MIVSFGTDMQRKPIANNLSIAAVVVTRNRRFLLENCINAIRAQTKQITAIIVVDNDSKDGTRQWLKKQPDLILIENSNSGGAGGFARGIDYAMQQNFHWIWCMDDDGKPALDAFEKVSPFLRPEFSAVNSMVVPGLDAKKTTFSLFKLKPGEQPGLLKRINEVKEIRALAGKKGYIYYGSFLNGTFLRREAVVLAGNIEPGFFIWGDEVDFFWRLWNVSPAITVPASLHFHPIPDPGAAPPWKLYYGLRNHIFINNRYMDHSLARNILLTIYYCSLFYKKPSSIRLFVRAILDGCKGKITAALKP